MAEGLTAHPGVTLYVAGPMTGYKGLNYPAFDQAEDALKEFGYNVLNPVRHDDGTSKGWEDYIRLGVADVLKADGVAVLPGWHNSKGAWLEVTVAKALGLAIKSVDQWLLHGHS